MQNIDKEKKLIQNNKKFRSGFVAIVGRTNVGKSTLINNILGQKILAVSSKAQTTRKKINCIYNDKDSQIIFMDIPGFLKPKTLLTEKLNNLILKTLKDADIIVMMADAYAGIGSGDVFVYDKIRDSGKPFFFVLNKTDLADKARIAEEKKKLIALNADKEIFEISALKKTNIKKFIEKLKIFLPENTPYFPDDILTDSPIRDISSEIIREKLIDLLDEELPHSVNIEIEKFEEVTNKKNLTKISAIIYVAKKSHKSIIIGRAGNILKKAGTQARLEIEKLLESKVFLELWVKIRENWAMKEKDLKEFGLIN